MFKLTAETDTDDPVRLLDLAYSHQADLNQNEACGWCKFLSCFPTRANQRCTSTVSRRGASSLSHSMAYRVQGAAVTRATNTGRTGDLF
jgi:hypothetical protein